MEPNYCIDCGVVITRRSLRCKSCAQKVLWDAAYRERQSKEVAIRWQNGLYGDRTSKFFCADCGVPVSRNSTRCKTCSSRDHWRQPGYAENQAACTKQAWENGRYAHIDWPKSDGNPNWRSGKSEQSTQIRNSPEYRAWRRDVLFRDGYKCAECGVEAKKGKVILHVHHLEGFGNAPDKRFDPANGLTLCNACHVKLHHLRPSQPVSYDRHGERNPKAKLTWDQVREIRKRYAADGIRQKDLAHEYGVTQANIGFIVRGETWREAIVELTAQIGVQ